MGAIPQVYEAAIEVPAVDLAPGHPVTPSMEQSLAVAWDFDRLVALGLREGSHAVFASDAVAIGVGLGLDTLVAFLVTQPTVLTHEEWHLAALREGGVTGVDRFLRGEITDVSDADLARFKGDDPSGLVRAHSAGVEAQNALVRRIGDEAFLHGPEALAVGPADVMGTWTAPFAQALEVNTWNYLRYCSSGKTDQVVPFIEENIDGGPAERDFTGPDCTAWVRDLRRPDEPYAARGPHASGVGVGRSVQTADLSPDERRMLRGQTALHWLDLANPHLFGIDRIRVGEAAFTVSAMHWLTPYGWAVDLHGGIRGGSGGPAVLATLRAGVSDRPRYPAVEVEVLDVPLGDAVRLATGVEGWLQPDDLRWGASPAPGGRLSARAAWRAHDRLEAWVGVEGKSAGWTPGLAALDPAVYGRLGATALLGRPARSW